MKDTNINQHEQEKTVNVWANKSFYVLCAICLLAIGFASFTAYRELNATPKNEDKIQTPSATVSMIPIPQNKEESQPAPTVSSDPVIRESAADASPVATFFIAPISGAEIYKSFSATDLQYSNTYNDYRIHAATDFISEVSDVVTACGDGIVTTVESDPLLGTVVTVDHGNGILASYCGLSDAVKVKIGDTVSSTTELGTLGVIPSETLDVAHLHLIFTKDGTPVSAMNYIQ